MGVETVILEEIQSYRYGDLIKFGVGGNAVDYQEDGWASPDKDYTWTAGRKAQLTIPIKQPDSALLLKVIQRPFLVKGKLAKQRVKIYVEGKRTGEWIISAEGECQMEIPQDHAKDSLLNILFELPDARKPKGLESGNDDDRMLAIAFKEMFILENIASREKSKVTEPKAVPLKVFKQEISAPVPLKVLKVKEVSAMEVTVKNTGNEIWPHRGNDEKATNRVSLGFYWLDRAGNVIEEGRALLPKDLLPETSAALKVNLQAPTAPGDYKLHFSMVQEHVAWFDDKGAVPFVINVKVEQNNK